MSTGSSALPGGDSYGAPRRSPGALARAAADAVPPSWLILIGIFTVQFGAAVAKDLFAVLPPAAIVWLRLLTSAAVLLAFVRPRLRGHTRADWIVAVGFGLCLAFMNFSIYQSFSRIPLGVAVTIEFLGPLAVSVIGSRRKLDLVWVLLAGAGVVLLARGDGDIDPVGVLFALAAGACWAGYILFSAATGARFSGQSGLAIASAVGVVVIAPMGVSSGGTALLNPELLLLGVFVGLMSSVIPYSLELEALRKIPPRVFGILMSLEPAAAALIGMVVLGELLSGKQWIAVACVIVASIGATRTASGRTKLPPEC